MCQTAEARARAADSERYQKPVRDAYIHLLPARIASWTEA